jgi:hypothetical protein
VNQRLALLQRQARANNEQRKNLERAHQERLAALKAQEAELNRQRAEVEGLLGAKRDPIAWLQAGGFTYEQAAAQVLSNGKPTPDALLSVESGKLRDEIAKEREAREAEVKAAREEQEKLSKQLQDAQNAEQQRNYQAFRQGTIDYVAANAEKYELTAKLPNGGDEVQRLMEAAYQRDAQIAEQEGREPRLMTREQAATAVEDYLRKQLDSVAGTKYFSSRFKPVEQPAQGAVPQPGSQPAAPGSPAAAAAAAVPAATEEGPPPAFERRTLSGSQPAITNAVVATPGSPAPYRKKTEEERWAAAKRAMEEVESRARNTAS